ncbi:S8 family peptidase [Sutcliffiella cohnii]|uniref:S8 family peptidase n=1 Tax=Sutcliffiella cohnii TaxID=33932 RepID=UPI000833A36D|nr:S8 family serine peptidase [Sutcliffiella cohnii]
MTSIWNGDFNLIKKGFIILLLFSVILIIMPKLVYEEKKSYFTINSDAHYEVLKIINGQNINMNIHQHDLKKVKVGIIDSGLLPSEELNLKIINKSETNNKEELSNFHGNIVASIISATETKESTYKGIIPGIELYYYDIPADELKIESLINAISSLTDLEMDIINISMGTNIYDLRLKSIVEKTVQEGTTIVVSAGNSSTEEFNYPASFDIKGIISVGALDSQLNILKNSTVNNKIDTFAPGENIQSIVNGDLIMSSGTSVSTPFVTSIIILLKAKCPNLTPKQINDIITSTNNIYNGRWGGHSKTIKLLNAQEVIITPCNFN